MHFTGPTSQGRNAAESANTNTQTNKNHMDLFKRLFAKKKDDVPESYEICYSCNGCLEIIEVRE